MTVNFSLEIDDSELLAATERLGRMVDLELSRAVGELAEKTAAAARREHDFKNRTRTLEGSIESTPPVGAFSSDSLQASAVAGAEYAAFVERKIPYLGPAWDSIEPYASEALEAALARAAREAGWA